MKINKALIVGAGLLAGIVSITEVKAQDEPNKWAPEGIKIDGNASEWPKP